ncbi:metalloregulator ArsR/SmtB family transcription factor [Variovorax sp. J22R133]|uniref:ArsR/SmtB family transcription factor n=1 Tax=Variovorax brevis TaxID=3053503 RepID=UPI0025764C52|nr:metalloregulator ArsR/SmtB family transcription factor [Variovorax sp. J22R133]MDM0113602.1 metalloregulator ArsR/SmtB family transcription factor [Variovorax sp. J22R133]
MLKPMLNPTIIDTSLRALAEPTRRAIIERLSRGAASVSELAKPFDMTLAAVVQHLQVLEESGLIQTKKIGRVRMCRLDTGGLDCVADWVAARRTFLGTRIERSGPDDIGGGGGLPM